MLFVPITLQVKSEWNNYESSYGKDAGEGIKDRSKTTQLVDVFYSLVGGGLGVMMAALGGCQGGGACVCVCLCLLTCT
jgi:hypothetical protein